MKKNGVSFVTLLLCIIFLSGCKWPLESTRYEMTKTSEGKVYRLDNQTGEVHYVSPEGMFQLYDETPLLKVGSYYEMGDVTDNGKEKYLKYLGNGQFEKSAWAIRNTNEKNDPLGIK